VITRFCRNHSEISINRACKVLKLSRNTSFTTAFRLFLLNLTDPGKTCYFMEAIERLLNEVKKKKKDGKLQRNIRKKGIQF